MDDYIIKEIDKVSANEIESKRSTHDIFIVFKDKRDKSYKQIRFMYVILNGLAKETYGSNDKWTVEELKHTLYEDYAAATGQDFYRTQVATVTQMRMFIDWLIKTLAVDFGYTLALELVEEEFKTSYIYAMTLSRKCCVCGDPGLSQAIHIHHIDKVGRGGNREKTDHTKKRLISLCAKCHFEEHATGDLLTRNLLYGIKFSVDDLKYMRVKGNYSKKDMEEVYEETSTTDQGHL